MIVYNLESLNDLSGFYIVYKGSALTESPEERGLNHLIEHLVCKSAQWMTEEFDEHAIFFNAITSDNYIVYYITGLDEYVGQYKHAFFEEITKKHQLDESYFLQEKKIVLEEYRLGFADRYRSYRYNFFRKYFDYYCAIGDKTVIEKCDLDLIQKVYEKQYEEPYMVINVSKNDTYSVLDSNPRHHCLYRQEPIKLLPKVSFQPENLSEVPGNAVQFILNKSLIPNEELPKTQFVNYMLCGNLWKPLYKTLRDDLGLCYYANLKDYCLDDQHLVLFSTETSIKNKDKLQSAFISILDNPKPYFTKNLFEQTLTYLMAQKRIIKNNRYNDVVDIFYNNVFRNDNLSSITYDAVISHFEKYYVGCDDHFMTVEL